MHAFIKRSGVFFKFANAFYDVARLDLCVDRILEIYTRKYLFMRYIQGTFAVAAGVLALSLIIAVVSAWLVANYRFALSNFFEYALILPFAIPAYIFSFCYVGIMDYGGYFHQIFGFRLEFMNIYGAIFVLSLSLYPYILYTC